jgi:hypothetical protein
MVAPKGLLKGTKVKFGTLTGRGMAYLHEKYDGGVVRWLVDATVGLTGEVIESDRKRAKAGCPDGCVLVNWACREHGADSAVFGLRTSYLQYGKYLVRFRLPEYVTRKIVAFDKVPQRFEVGPVQVNAVGASNATGKIRNKDRRPKGGRKHHIAKALRGDRKNNKTANVRTLDLTAA